MNGLVPRQSAKVGAALLLLCIQPTPLVQGEQTLPLWGGQAMRVGSSAVHRERSHRAVDGRAVHGGDIVLRTAVEATRASDYVWPEDYVWPGGVIPYVIDEGLEPYRQNVLDAIEEWNSKTVITLKERTREGDYVQFTGSNRGCFSAIGKVGGEQLIELRESCASQVNVIVHEIGHAVGLWHSHQRRDRDRYLSMSQRNVAYCDDPVLWTKDVEPLGPYDFASTMHYGPGDFPDRPVFETIPPGLFVGYNRDGTSLSVGDIDLVARIYGHPPTATTITTNPPGLDVIVDGVRVTTPASFGWTPGSEHQLEAVRHVTMDDGYRFVFGRWSDDGDRLHTFTAHSGTTWLAANYIVQYLLGSPQAEPSSAGTTTLRPESPDGFYTFGTTLELSATADPSSGYRFGWWSWGNHFEQYQGWLPGQRWNPAYPVLGVGTTPRPVTAYFVNQPWLELDSNVYNATIVIKDPQLGEVGRTLPAFIPGGDGDRVTIRAYDEVVPWDVRHVYRFQSWSDGRSDREREVVTTEGGSLTLHSAAFFPLLTIVRLSDGEVLSSDSTIRTSPVPEAMTLDTTGSPFFAAGTRVQVRAVPESGHEFVAWMGDASGSNPVTNVVADTTRIVEAVFHPERGRGLRSGEPVSLAADVESATYWLYVPPGSTQLAIDLEVMPSAADWSLTAHHGRESGDPRRADFQSTSLDGIARLVVTPESSPPLTEGPYYITVASGSGSGTGSLVATLTGGPVVRMEPRALTFVAPSTADPAEQTVQLTNKGDSPLQYGVLSDQQWLTAWPASGAVPVDGTTEISVAVSGAAMLADTYTGRLTIGTSGRMATADRVGPAIQVTFAVVETADLVVASASGPSPDSGQSFVLRSTVRNEGTGASPATTLRFYRSADSAISTGDVQVGTAAVAALSSGGTSSHAITLKAPTTGGTYHYGACVDSVPGESDAGNNCSRAVAVPVAGPAAAGFDLTAPNADARGITFANNRFYVPDWAYETVYAYSASGQFLPDASFDLTALNQYPDGITFANNRLFVVDSAYDEVYAYSASGQFLPDAGFDLTTANQSPFGITFANNRFYVVDGHSGKVYTYSASGQFLPDAGFDLTAANQYPFGITFADNRLYVADSDFKVYAYLASGQFLPDAGFESPFPLYAGGITFANNRFYVADSHSGKVYAYSASGTPIGTVDPTPGGPDPVTDEYTPLDDWTVSDGRVQFFFLSAGQCVNVGNVTLNGVTYTVHSSKWQRRANANSAWSEVPGTEHTGGVCSYSPTEPGHYRGVAEISIGGERGKFASKNFLTVE